MVPTRFVSISAVNDRLQLDKIARIYEEEGLTIPLVIGYQVSNKSINQGSQNSRQPKFSELGELDKATRELGLYTAIHYYTKDSSTIIDDLRKIAESGVEPGLLQFNTLPLSVEMLGKARDMGYKIIFKVAVSDKGTKEGGYAVWKGEGVQDISDANPEPLLNQVLERKDAISYAMFDPSHGTNLGLDLDEKSLAVRFGKGIVSNDKLNHLNLVYAGGINPENVGNVTNSLNRFLGNRFSVDVESGIRVDDQLNFDLARRYLRNYRNALDRF